MGVGRVSIVHSPKKDMLRHLISLSIHVNSHLIGHHSVAPSFLVTAFLR
jgi:hypothetical protein